MDEEDRAGGREFGGEVPVAHGVDRVRERAAHADLLRGEGGIGRERRPRHGAGAERADGGPFQGVLEAAGVAAEPVVVAEEHVAEHDRLGVLQVGDPGEDRVRVLLRPRGEGLLEVPDGLADLLRHGPRPEPEVERDLVVAAAGGVELGADRGADEVDQPLLDVHVDVFVGDVERELARIPVVEDVLQPGDDADHLLLGQDALLAQHLRVGDGALDVLDHEVGVGVDGRDELRRELVRRLGEPFPDDLCHSATQNSFSPQRHKGHKGDQRPRRSALFIERRRPFMRMKPSASFEL
jgi:hypothetical protein